MTKSKPPDKPRSSHADRRARERRVSSEEERLWAQVMKSAKPLPRKGGQAERRDISDRQGGEGSIEHTPPGSNTTPRRANAARYTITKSDRETTSPEPGFATIHRRELRRLDRGQENVEARLDLHGMRQAQAHEALRRFVVRCRAQGLRHVLIITGKGQSGTEPEHFELYEDQSRGVLRQNVPLWLEEPGLKDMIVGYAPAPNSHGGEGALYVRLRRMRGVRTSKAGVVN